MLVDKKYHRREQWHAQSDNNFELLNGTVPGQLYPTLNYQHYNS